MSLENDETLDLNPLTPLPQPQQVNGRDADPQPTAKSGANQTKKGRKDRKAYSAAQAEAGREFCCNAPNGNTMAGLMPCEADFCAEPSSLCHCRGEADVDDLWCLSLPCLALHLAGA